MTALSATFLLAANIQMDLNAKYGDTNFHTLGAKEFAKLADKYSKGTVKIRIHAGGSLIKGNPLKAVKDGTVAMTDMFIPFTAGGGKVFGISALPFISKSYDEAFKLYQISKPSYEKVAKEWNQKLLYAVSWPASGLYTKKAVKSIKDFKDLKTRTYDANSANFINTSGGSAVALPWGEVYSALRTGLVNSVVTSSASGKDGKFWEVLDHFTKINYAYPLQAVTINLDYWNALSKSQQKALLKAAAAVEKAQWKKVKIEDKNSLKALSDNGVTIHEASSSLKKELDTMATKMLDTYLDDSNYEIEKIFKEYGFKP